MRIDVHLSPNSVVAQFHKVHVMHNADMVTRRRTAPATAVTDGARTYRRSELRNDDFGHRNISSFGLQSAKHDVSGIRVFNKSNTRNF